MKLTLLGALCIVAGLVLLVYAGQQLEQKLKEAKQKNEQARKPDGNRSAQS